jgi:hypothetical protein
MRALWLDAGSDPDFAKAKREGMTALYLPISDPMADLQRRAADIRANGYAVGVYMAHNPQWPQFWGIGGASISDKMHSLVAQVGGKVKVQFDYEQHTPADYVHILAMLSRFRALQPAADISWTMEGHQGATMAAEFVELIVRLKVRVVPQCYDAPMTHSWCPLAMTRDLTKRGFSDALVSPFYDAAKLDQVQWWQGFAFLQSRLP